MKREPVITHLIMISNIIISGLLVNFLFFIHSKCACPEGFVPFEEKACFFYQGYNVDTITRNDANAVCRSRFLATLATIDNPDQELFLVNKYMTRELTPTNHQTAWIGLIRAANDDSVWTWDDASTSQYRHWNPNEPNNYRDQEDCVLIVLTYVNGTRKYGWNDAVCEPKGNIWYSKASGFFCRLPFFNHINDDGDDAIYKYSNLAKSNAALSVTVTVLLLIILVFVAYFLWTKRDLILTKFSKINFNRTVSMEELRAED